MNTTVAAVLCAGGLVVMIAGMAMQGIAISRDRARRNQSRLVWWFLPMTAEKLPQAREELNLFMRGDFFFGVGFSVTIAVICYAKGRGW